MKFSAVILAAGRSSRFVQNQQFPNLRKKVFVEWDGKPLFVHSIEALSRVFHFNQIVLVIAKTDEDYVRSCLDRFSSRSLFNLNLVFGGERRQDSVREGLSKLEVCDRVAIHDAARPFCSQSFLENLKEESKRYPALIPVIPIAETVKRVDAAGVVKESLDRNSLVRVQTPQIFEYDLIKNTHEKLRFSEKEFTDDAMMLEELGCSVMTTRGCSENIKVTLPEDLANKGLLTNVG